MGISFIYYKWKGVVSLWTGDINRSTEKLSGYNSYCSCAGNGQFMTVCGKKIFMLYIIRTVKMEPPIPLKQVSWHWKMCDLRIL